MKETPKKITKAENNNNNAHTTDADWNSLKS